MDRDGLLPKGDLRLSLDGRTYLDSVTCHCQYAGMNAPRPRYSLTELADLGGVTPRTVRYYISQGLLRSPIGAGPGPKYDDTDLARLRLIKRLQRDHQPLAQIRKVLDGLGDEQIRHAESDLEPAPTDSALDYLRRVMGSHQVRETRLSPLYASVPPPLAEPASPAAPPPDDVRLERSQWERIDLAPDVELHIRRPLVRSTAKRVDRLIAIARDLLEEDPSRPTSPQSPSAPAPIGTTSGRTAAVDSATRTVPGSGAATRTPTACSVSTSPRAPTCRSTAGPTSMPSPVRSTDVLDRRWAG